MQNVKYFNIADFDPLVRVITKAQPLFENFGDKMLLAGFELPGEMYDTLDSAVALSEFREMLTEVLKQDAQLTF